MMRHSLLPITLGFFLLGTALVPCARADAGSKEIRFTVNAPVEIPREVLPPGSYYLRLVEDDSTIAEVWNTQGTQFYGYFNTIPVDRNRAGKLRLDLADSGPAAPKRIEDWFYPGDKRGYELLYPAAQSEEMSSCTCANQRASR